MTLATSQWGGETTTVCLPRWLAQQRLIGYPISKPEGSPIMFEGIFLMVDLIEIDGAAKIIRTISGDLSNGNPSINAAISSDTALTGSDVLHMSLEATDVALEVLSIWLSAHHIARASIRLRRNGRRVKLDDKTTADEIKAAMDDGSG